MSTSASELAGDARRPTTSIVVRAPGRPTAGARARAALVAQYAALRRGAPLFALPVLFAPWLLRCTARYLEAPLFSDVGMFRFSGWAFARGERLYVDVASPDGPLIHVLHALFFAIVGDDDHRFRGLDLSLQLAIGAAVGLAAPSVVSRRVRASGRAAIVCAALVVWGAWFFGLDWSMSAQREDYYAAMGLTGMVLLAVATETASWRVARVLLVAGGALTGAQVLGKHTGVVYLGLGALAVAASPPRAGRSRAVRLALVVLGAALACGALLAVVAARGSLAGMRRWYFDYAFGVYRYFALVKWEDLWAKVDPTYAEAPMIACVAALGAIRVRLLPRSTLGLSLAPPLLFAAGIAQAKGWNYQFAPALAAVAVLALLLLAASFEPLLAPEADETSAAARAVAPALAWLMLVATVVGCIGVLQSSYWLATRDWTKLVAEIPDRTKAAEAVKTATSEGDRVFYVGDDSELLMLANRLPANPYFASFFLDFNFALQMKSDGPEPPSAAGEAKIRALQAEVERDACARLAKLPAALVLDTKTAAGADGRAILIRRCRGADRLLKTRYQQRETVGRHQVWTRTDT